MNEQLNLFLPGITTMEYHGGLIKMNEYDKRPLSERDIPKTPIYYHDSEREYMSFFTCPCCNSTLTFSATGAKDYCSDCGQRLEWDKIIDNGLL